MIRLVGQVRASFGEAQIVCPVIFHLFHRMITWAICRRTAIDTTKLKHYVGLIDAQRVMNSLEFDIE